MLSEAHYNYYRDYDPGLGRYLQSDLLGLRAGLNTYSYAFGRPLVWSDAFGLDSTVCFYRDAAHGFGHVGAGPGDGSSGTSGFYPGGANGMGQIKPDNQKDKVCTTLASDSTGDDCMQKCKEKREGNPGPYNVLTRQCTSYVRDCLTECKIIKKSYGGPLPDLFFTSIGGPDPHPNSGPVNGP